MASSIRCIRVVKKILNYEFLNSFNCTAKTDSFPFHFHTSALFSVKGTDIKMPSLSPTMTMGTIVKWYKKEGDAISPGDVLCDIQTDKAVMSFEIEEEGVLAKVLIPEGTAEIQVGTSIGVIVNEGEDWRSVEIPDNSEQNDQVVNDDNEPNSQKVLMPSLSPTMTEGTIVKWHKKEGDAIFPGDVLCDIQTDKAVMAFEIEEEGVLAKILIEEGRAGVEVGSLLALIVPEGVDWRNIKLPSSDTPSSCKIDAMKNESDSEKISSVSKASNSTTTYGPAVRILLELYQINGSQMVATGRNGKLLKSDVLNYITANKLQPKPLIPVALPKTNISKHTASNEVILPKKIAHRHSDVELSSMRKTIANRLVMSKKTIPHAYATVTCTMDELLSLRKQMKSAGIGVSVNDFFIKAVALALAQCPHVNKLYVDGKAIAVPDIDVSVAVATNSGLITPIIKKADEKSVSEISVEVKELAEKARQGKLQLHEFHGGSFTISNLGMFAISEFSAIINPPQCAILAVGGGIPFVDINKKVRTKVTSTLSYDSRVISESAAADFLESIQWLLQNPVNIVLGSTKDVAKRYA